MLARSAYERYREACGHAPEIAEGLYPGDYLVDVGAAMKAKWGESLLDQPESVWLAQVRDFATDAMMALIRDDLAALGVTMDNFYSEKSLYGSGRNRGSARRFGRQGPDLRRHAGPAQGQDA